MYAEAAAYLHEQLTVWPTSGCLLFCNVGPHLGLFRALHPLTGTCAPHLTSVLVVKVIAQYHAVMSDHHTSEEELLAIFNKKISRNPTFKVLKDKVKLLK